MFKRRLYVPPPVAPLRPVVGCTAVMARPSVEVVAVPKPSTFRSDKWLAAVRTLPCCWCMRDGPSEAAHRNESKGMGLKASDAWTVPLCHEHHAEFDQGKLMTREEKRAMFDQWLIVTINALASKGLVRA